MIFQDPYPSGRPISVLDITLPSEAQGEDGLSARIKLAREFAEMTQAEVAKAMAAGDDPAGRADAENALSAPVARLMAVAEAYPEMKASGNFADLQKELSDTETKIEMARRFYNGAVRELNTAVQTFPANLFAGAFGFRERQYFEIEIADRALPKVDMGKKS
jgi:LemA protein